MKRHAFTDEWTFTRPHHPENGLLTWGLSSVAGWASQITRPPSMRRAGVSLPASPHSDHTDDYIDVPARRLRVRAGLVRDARQRLGDFSLHTRQADVQPSLQEVSAIGGAQID